MTASTGSSRESRSYGHFCILAKALEVVGDRWALLVVRDLAWGPRRFTDLRERLVGITPKTLAQRLRDLEGAGIIEAEREAGRREVWYRLSPKGEELGPALDELVAWGLRHEARPPQPGEASHPEHLLWALRVQLEHEDVRVGSVQWVVHILDDGATYLVSNEKGQWKAQIGDAADPDVTITATRHALTRFLTTPPKLRTTDQPDLQIAGDRSAVRTFLKAIEVFPLGRARAA